MAGQHDAFGMARLGPMPTLRHFVREVAQNVAMAIPAVRSIAARRHTLAEETPGDEAVYESYRRHTEVAGKAILELGPGRRLDQLRTARRDGAVRCTAVDVIGYRIPDQAARDGIEYHVYDGRHLPFGDGEFDLVWSWAVLEHLRYPDITVPEIVRVLKPGGLVIGRIDLRDHYHLVSGAWTERVEWLDCLRYPAWVWRAMKWYRAAYVNRLRYSDWLGLLAAAGLEQIAIRTQRSPVLQAARRREAHLRRYSEDDVAVFGLDIVYQKPLPA